MLVDCADSGARAEGPLKYLGILEVSVFQTDVARVGGSDVHEGVDACGGGGYSVTLLSTARLPRLHASAIRCPPGVCF